MGAICVLLCYLSLTNLLELSIILLLLSFYYIVLWFCYLWCLLKPYVVVRLEIIAISLILWILPSRENAQLVGGNLLDIRTKLYDALVVETLFGNHKVTFSQKVAKVLPRRSLNQMSLMLNLKRNDRISLWCRELHHWHGFFLVLVIIRKI